MARARTTLFSVDVEGDKGVAEAEDICSRVKTAQHTQKVAFVCNWRVAHLTDCPDEILRTEFDPSAFVKGVRKLVSSADRLPRASAVGR